VTLADVVASTDTGPAYQAIRSFDVVSTAHASISLLHDVADRLDTWERVPPWGERRDRGRTIDQLLLLASLTATATPPELVDNLLPFDLPDPELAAAYRLLRESDFDLGRARATTVHPDVAGVLDTVGTYAEARAGRFLTQGQQWAGLLSERRRRMLEADRLRWVAGQILRTGLTGFAALAEANRAIDAAHERIPGDRYQPPAGLPEGVPTARRRLLGPTAPDVMLEDDAIATRLVDLIEVADRRVLLAVPWVRQSPVFDRLLSACRLRLAHGVRVLLVTRPVQMSATHQAASAADRDAKRSLVEAGVEVRWRKHLHDKVFVVDDTVICGSQNLTNADIGRNPNSAIGSGSTVTVDAFADRIEQLSAMPRRLRARVADAELPVFAYDGDSGFSHRLDIAGDTDLGALEGGGTARGDCGDDVVVDHVSRIWAFDFGEPCPDCRPPLS
jgi:hypothetical protein